MFKMWKLFVILLVALHFADLAQAKYGKYDDSQNSNNAENPKAKTSRGLGISAWGLVFLIVAFILLGVGAYYVAIFYPLLCKKERKYDRIELSTI